MTLLTVFVYTYGSFEVRETLVPLYTYDLLLVLQKRSGVNLDLI